MELSKTKKDSESGVTPSSQQISTVVPSQEKRRAKPLLLASAITIALTLFQSLYNFSVVNVLDSTLENIYGWSSEEANYKVGLVGSISLASATIGSFFAHKLQERVGRRGGIFVTNICFFMVGDLLCMVKRYEVLLIGRFFVGFGITVGALCASNFLIEIAPTNLRGFIGSFYSVFFALGGFAAYLSGLMLPEPNKDNKDDTSWRFCFLIPVIASLLQCLLLLTVVTFDSPKWLWLKGEKAKATAVLNRVQFEEEVTVSMTTLNKIEKAMATKGVSSRSLAGACNKDNRRPLRLSILLIGYTKLSGLGAVLLFSSSIFGKINEDADNQEEILYTILFVGIPNVIGALFGASTMAKYPRKTLWLAGSVGMTMSCSLLAIFNVIDIAIPQIICVMLIIFLFQVSVGPCSWVYIGEILDPQYIIIPRAFHWASLGVVALFTKSLISGIGIVGTFLFFAISGGLGTVATKKYMIETKGLVTEEIRALFGHSAYSDVKFSEDNVDLTRNQLLRRDADPTSP